MRANRRRDTGPELRVRRQLHAMGLRFRVDHPVSTAHSRPIRPDIAFTRARVAVFIDGCFWHGCLEHGRRKTISNAGYWEPKIERNRERDTEQTAYLERAGWRVLRFWEHEDAGDIADTVASVVRSGSPGT